jgi:hypothetical protein
VVPSEGGEEEGWMIPISFSWDTQKRFVSLKWNGFFSLRWGRRKASTKVLGLSIPIPFRKRKARVPLRWVYLKGVFSFLTNWKLKKVETYLSFSDPMVNGLLYGWMRAVETVNVNRKINVTINFLGENGSRGEFIICPKILFHHLRKWILPLLLEMRGRRA